MGFYKVGGTILNTAQQGFTLIELVIVIIILGVLSATALPRFLNLADDADIAVVKGTGGAFKSAVTLAHTKWAIMGGKEGLGENNDIPLYGTGTEGIMDFNDAGWPVQSYEGEDSELSLSNQDDCISVWNTILHTDSKIDMDSGFNDDFTVEYGPEGVCAYKRTNNLDLYIRYDSNTGAVETIIP